MYIVLRMGYNNLMNNTENLEYFFEIIPVFEMEFFDGDVCSAWLEFAIDGDWNMADFGQWLIENDFEVIGKRKGVNGWDEFCVKGDIERIVQVIREFY